MKITWLYYLRNLPYYLFFGLIKVLPWKFCYYAHCKTAITTDQLAEIKNVPYYIMLEYLTQESQRRKAK